MRPHFIALAPVALALLAAGCGGTGTPDRTAAVSVRHTRLGSVLVDGGGRTLYEFEKDKGPASRCSGACAGVWPPLTSKPEAGRGVAAAKLGMTAGGGVTYAGHPLYTYAGDGKPGDVKGQSLDQFGADWYVFAPSGRAIG